MTENQKNEPDRNELERVLDAIPDLIMILGDQWRIRMVNGSKLSVNPVPSYYEEQSLSRNCLCKG